MITRDEWLAEFERVLADVRQRESEGLTTEELCAAWGVSAKTVYLRLKGMRDRVVVGRRSGISLDGKPMLTPCYKLKTEAHVQEEASAVPENLRDC
jgi:hypothetical protein